MKSALRLLTSVWFGIGLLALVGVYAVLASVPIGVLALAPTYFIYAIILLSLMAGIAALPLVLSRKVLFKQPSAMRFVATVSCLVGAVIAGALVWRSWLWPALHYDPATGGGLMLFPSFVNHWKGTTLRRLPGFEMTEAEFYAWWPLRVILLLFITNMVVATIRRIEFTLVNLGVLTVHTGIVLLALGSLRYWSQKVEGDTILLAGERAADGSPTPGPAQDGFFDNTQIALWITQRTQGAMWEPRPLRGLPRYNDYNLLAGIGKTAGMESGLVPAGDDASLRTLDIDVPSRVDPGELDPDLRVRVVGYAQYATLEDDWVQTPVIPGAAPTPLRTVELLTSIPDVPAQATPKPALVFTLLPTLPPKRVSERAGLIGVEYTQGPTAGMSENRWRALSATLPANTDHALFIRIAATGEEQLIPITPPMPGESTPEHAIGSSGYRVMVKSISPTPPFPIITEGYRNATSSVAIVRIIPPTGPGYERWVYHRYPEISQDMLDTLNERGMPTRRDADPAIDVQYIDASQLQIYIDEPSTDVVRTIIRTPGQETPTVRTGPAGHWTIENFAPRGPGDPKLDLAPGLIYANAKAVQRPVSVPERDRQRDAIGTHHESKLAVEISSVAEDGSTRFSQVVWLAFSKYMGGGLSIERSLELPDGRSMKLAFGRRRHRFDAFVMQLTDFELVEYEHRGAPKDYRATVRVSPTARLGNNEEPQRAGFSHVISLNTPLQAPFRWEDQRGMAGNVLGTIASRFDPKQLKFSQAGWDAGGWERTRQQADRGEIPRPFASFTILQVGNNPGIHVVALGGVLMGLGTPWAFYIKPWIMRRRKQRIQQQLAAGTYVKPGQVPVAEPAASTTHPEPRPLGASQ